MTTIDRRKPKKKPRSLREQLGPEAAKLMPSGFRVVFEALAKAAREE